MSYVVSWNEYQKNIFKGFGGLQQRGEFVDMTIAAEGHHVKVHQMIMSLVSPYIKDLITSANCPHPVIFLNKVSYHTLQSILEYAYTGEVVVQQARLGEFIQASHELHIKGLENMVNTAKTSLNEKYILNTEARSKENEMQGENTMANNDSRAVYDKTAIINTVFVDEFVESYNDTDDNNDGNDAASEVNTAQSMAAKKEVFPVGKQPSFQYSLSSHGKLQIVLNRFIYSLRHTRKDKQRFWRCVSQQETRCPACVTTQEDKITKRAHTHNHPYHDRQILKRVQNENMFKALNELENAVATKKSKGNEHSKTLFQKDETDDMSD